MYHSRSWSTFKVLLLLRRFFYSLLHFYHLILIWDCCLPVMPFGIASEGNMYCAAEFNSFALLSSKVNDDKLARCRHYWWEENDRYVWITRKWWAFRYFRYFLDCIPFFWMQFEKYDEKTRTHTCLREVYFLLWSALTQKLPAVVLTREAIYRSGSNHMDINWCVSLCKWIWCSLHCRVFIFSKSCQPYGPCLKKYK